MKLRCSILLLIGLGVSALEAASISTSTPPPAPPPLPSIKALKLEPATLTLRDGRDERRVLVLGKTGEGDKTIDLTTEASFKAVKGEGAVKSIRRATFEAEKKGQPKSWCPRGDAKRNYR